MRVLRTTFLLFSVALSPAIVQATPALGVATGTAMPDEPGDLTLPFSITADTQVPGKVLKSGKYTLRVVDHLRDRVVLRIENSSGKSESLFLGLPNTSLGSVTGPVSWGKAGKHVALRGFVFPGGNAVEFVYQKEQAVEIAKATSMKVPAIDPASEGMKANSDLSHDDMAMITLWKLSPTQVGPQAGIQAERVSQPGTTPAAAPVQTAQVTRPSAPLENSVASAAIAPRVHVKKPTPAPSTQVAALHRPAPLTVLPHTGSELPEILLAAFGLLGAAGSLRVARFRKA